MTQLIKIFMRLICLLLVITMSLTSSAQDTLLTRYPDTQQAWEKIFVAGKKTAENIYHDNGTPWMTFQYKENNKEIYKWYHENGNPFFEATNINGKLQGAYRIWYENGQLAEELNFIDNLEDGIAEYFHPNGQLAMAGAYKQGKMIGDWQFISQDGTLADGDWKWVFAALPEFTRMQGKLNDGKPVGEWTYRTTAASELGTQATLYWER